VPLVAWGLAAVADYVDGPIARRAGGASAYGVVLDSGADIAFVLIALGAGAATGRLSWLVPAAIACAATPYLVATLRRARAQGGPARAFSRIGHWGGVCNYALAGLLAGSVALPTLAPWTVILALGSAVVVTLNMTGVAMRLRGRADAR
jgi:phosphatidylglycerophosphate synthase